MGGSTGIAGITRSLSYENFDFCCKLQMAKECARRLIGSDLREMPKRAKLSQFTDVYELPVQRHFMGCVHGYCGAITRHGCSCDAHAPQRT